MFFFFFNLISVHLHETITLIVVDWASCRLIDRNLRIVCTKSMTVSVRVGEHSSLEHLVVRNFNSWNDVARRESRLFDLGKVVGCVTVEHKLAKWLQRVVGMRPHLGNIEDVESVLSSIYNRNNTNNIILN